MSDSNGARNVTTPRLGLNKPAVGADLDIWGDYLNSNCDVLDNSFLVSGGVFTGAVGGYPTSSAGAPAFSVSSGAGIYAQGASMGVASFNTNVFVFSLSNNQSSVPLSMANNRITNLANPTLGTDAVNLNTVASMGTAYLPVAGGQMLGQINMGGNLLTGLALPQNPTDATSKQYVDALIADMRLFVDTWQVAANIPDISNISTITAGDYYIAVTANPTVPETAPSNIPGIGGMTINNGDMVIYSEATAQYELVRGGPLTVAEADALFVNKAGDSMTGGLAIVANAGLSLRTPLGGVLGIDYDGFGALGRNIAFGISAGILYVYQNGLAVAGLLNLSGGTMTGPVILSGDATQALGAATLQQVQSIAGNYLPLSGGVLSGGLSLGSRLAASNTDLSQHLALWGTTDGIGVTSGRMNYVAGASHVFISGGNDQVLIGTTGLVTNNITGRTAGTLVIAGLDVSAGGVLLRGGTGGGAVTVQGGAALTTTATSGGVSMNTGNLPAGSTGTSGNINVQTSNAPASGTAASGSIFYNTGAAYGRASGNINFTTGNGINGASSGNITFGIGNVVTDPTGTATRGRINLNGPAFVQVDPTEPLQIASKQYVDAHSGGGGGDYLPIDGGTVLGSLAVDQTLTVSGLASLNGAVNCGGNGIAYTGLGWANRIAFNWNPGVSLLSCAVDGIYIDLLATTGWVTGGFLSLAGGTVSGPVAVNSVRSSTGAFYAHGGDSYMNMDAGGNWNWVTNGTPLGTLSTGGNFTIGGQLQGNTVVANGITSNGSITAGGTVNGEGGVYVAAAATGSGFYLGLTGAGRSLVFAPNSYLEWEVADQSLSYYTAGSGSVAWGYNNTVGAFINNRGGFSGNGPYSDFSSSRSMKRNIAAATYGLPEILQVEPVSFSRVPIEGIRDAPPQIGFIADDLRSIMPEAAIESIWESEPRLGLRTEPILAAAVNAIKELDARLRALEGVSRHVH